MFENLDCLVVAQRFVGDATHGTSNISRVIGPLAPAIAPGLLAVPG